MIHSKLLPGHHFNNSTVPSFYSHNQKEYEDENRIVDKKYQAPLFSNDVVSNKDENSLIYSSGVKEDEDSRTSYDKKYADKLRIWFHNINCFSKRDKINIKYTKFKSTKNQKKF